MKKPWSIWLVVCLLAAYGALALWAAVAAHHAAPVSGGILALAAAAGLLLGRRWSLALVYLITLVVAASWCYSIWILARAGWPFPDVTSSALTLLPGGLLVGVFALSSVLVFRHFRR
jgi:hypothetical protein